jgi:hypothetical protein
VPSERDDPLTDEMIEVGARLLNIHAEGCLGPHHSAHVAETVYRAMRGAAPPIHTQKSRRYPPVSKRHRQTA